MWRREPCLGPAELRHLLDGDLTPEEEGRLTDHLDLCGLCREALDELAAGGDSGPWPGLPAARPASEEALRRAIDALKAETRRLGTPPATSAGDEVLQFLSPTDEPGLLGKLGHYEVTGVVGRGGAGVVLKAFDPSLNRFVAIKVLAPQLATSVAARKRFAREGRAAAAVSHEHIVAIHGVDEAHGLPYLVMEYVAGISLQERLDRDGPLEVKEVLRIGMQTAAGLAAAHAQGLVHRDVKPGNILLESGIERVKLTDFGLARAADDASLTQSGAVAGTPQYMAPEQARGEPVDSRSDLFSLGSVLYAMCTGRAPFRAPTVLAVLRCVSEEAPIPVREINPDVPAWLAAVIDALHAKDPAERFQSAAEVAEALSRYLGHLQQPWRLPPPPPPRRRTSRRSLRRRVTLAALFALVLVLGGLAWRSGLPRRNDVGAPAPLQVSPRAGLDGFRGPVFAAAFTPGSELLALACDDRTVQLWDPTTAEPRWGLRGHTARVWSVAFAPDGKRLASGGGDWNRANVCGDLKLWDATTRKHLHTLSGHTGLVLRSRSLPTARRSPRGAGTRRCASGIRPRARRKRACAGTPTPSAPSASPRTARSWPAAGSTAASGSGMRPPARPCCNCKYRAARSTASPSRRTARRWRRRSTNGPAFRRTRSAAGTRTSPAGEKSISGTRAAVPSAPC
jgi:serine/threonine-protein kinase